MPLPTYQDALQYLGIDYAQDDAAVSANVKFALSAAISILKGGVGKEVETYFADDERARALVFIYLDDLYSERGVNAKSGSAKRRLVCDMELQLKLELRRILESRGEGGATDDV